MKSRIPRSRRSTHHTAEMVFMLTLQTRLHQRRKRRHSGCQAPPVVAQTRHKGGCETAMPRRKRPRRNVWTADNTSAMDARQESVAPSTVDSERIHKMSECITKGEPKLEAAPPASHGMVQPKCSYCSRTDPLPLGSGRLSPAGHDTPAEKPPAEMNICNTLQIEIIYR